MKNAKTLFALLLSLGLLFTACEKDDEDTAKPEVTIHELGQGDSHGNDHKATIGASLHMDVEIVAESKIDYIQVKIHPEGDEHKKDEHEHGWELDEKFSGTGISGLKNLDFHKDLAINTDAKPGEYHFHVIVVDMEGNSESAEAELTLVEQPTNVTVKDLSINSDSHDVSKASGSFVISFDATTKIGKLTSYSIEVHNHPESGKEEDEFKIVDKEFTENFSNKTSASVSKTITIDAAAPLGEYHVEIIIKDSEDNEKVLEGHIDLEK